MIQPQQIHPASGTSMEQYSLILVKRGADPNGKDIAELLSRSESPLAAKSKMRATWLRSPSTPPAGKRRRI
jgi:hypothetical protein